MVNDADQASDIVQDIFIYLYEKLQKGYRINHMRSWLSKAVYNRSVDFLRKPKRDVGLEALTNESMESPSLEIDEIKAAIGVALNKLKHNEKLLAILYSEGFSYKEMADISGIKLISIGKTLSRVLIKLKKDLTAHGHELH